MSATTRRAIQLAEEIQRLVYEDVPFVSWGQYVQPVVFSRKVRGALKFAAPVVWNIWMDA